MELMEGAYAKAIIGAKAAEYATEMPNASRVIYAHDAAELTCGKVCISFKDGPMGSVKILIDGKEIPIDQAFRVTWAVDARYGLPVLTVDRYAT